MSTPAEFYYSLPPVIKFYGTSCLLTTIAVHLGLVNPMSIYYAPGMVFKNLQIWRLITNFFFLGMFSPTFAFQLIMLARYGVQLERAYIQRGQFPWMMVVAVLTFLSVATVANSGIFSFMGPAIVFMIVYLWAREFPNVRVSILGLVSLQGFYLPWAMMFISFIFGHSIFLDFLGIVVGHLYYFLNVLHPRSGGKDYLRPPRFFLKLLHNWGLIDGAPRQPDRPEQPPQERSSAPPPSAAEGTAFRGRSYRLNRD